MNETTPQKVTDHPALPRESYGRIFLRFLRFGFLAWGGPVAQIAMIRKELVDEEKWVSSEHFNRALAVYQILPGPEAHELCVYFGMLSRGRLGGFLAGLGFMLPGFCLMFLLSWLYVTFGINSVFFNALFYGCQAAVAALIVRAVHRIGRHALFDLSLLGIAALAYLAEVSKVHFLFILIASGFIYLFFKKKFHLAALLCGLGLLAASYFAYRNGSVLKGFGEKVALSAPSLWTLFGSGLRSGLLTFGGAYTVIPFLQHDAVEVGAWMTNTQFLNGLALSGIIPAPLIIFSTFVGYLGGGPLGALLMTVGIFFPAFAFTLVGHGLIERLIRHKALHAFLDGVTAGVVGLIAAAAGTLLQSALINLPAVGIFIASILILYRWQAKGATALVVVGAGILGLLFFL